LILTAISPALSGEPMKETKSQAGWEEILNWLPENTETLIVSQKPFRIPKTGPKLESVADEMHLLPIISLLHFLPEWASKELLNQEVVCAVEGSRQSSLPRDFGPLRYQGCHVLEFKASDDEQLRKAFDACLKKAAKRITIAGQQVAVLTETRGKDVWTCYIARPRAGVLLFATDKDYLEGVLKRIGRKNEKRALPKDFPEWKHVDVKARVWAIFHSRGDAEKKTDAAKPDPADEGFVFWYDSGKTLHARCLSKDEEALKEMKQIWGQSEEGGFSAAIKQLVPGVISIEVAVNEKKIATELFLLILAHLGHAIIL
jgi:hypothetical protein